MPRNRFNMMTFDAQQALAFLVRQASYIEREVYQIQYPEVQYPDIVPVDTSAPEWVPSVTYYSMDGAGKMEWFHGQAQDVPHADVVRTKFETGVRMSAIGYSYDLAEIGAAQLLGQNLTSDKANVARRVAEEFADDKALYGDASVGFTGLTNNAGVTAADLPNGAALSPLWANKTPDEILEDLNVGLTGIYVNSKGIEMADTVLLPEDRLIDIGTRRLNDMTETTILSWLMRNNAYTMKTQRPLTIRGVRGLETAGTGGSSRMVVYRRDPSVVKMHMPMPFGFRPAYQNGPIMFEVPGIMRLGGVDVRRTQAFRYFDEL